jgi:uncharacterized membrane protein
VLAGVAIIVLAVLISAVTFGAYGWGLFVMMPFLVGMSTGYLANRKQLSAPGRTLIVVLSALSPLASGGTRLTVEADHVLRVDPALY